ncbi:type II toxin-antitoxin system VapC family toxin [Gandjariella thermophila]|uniref:Ribonuclease VapC n=1 Tax=Gandjariella thermophila TaxID=1931992 RepID=A0A4D4JI03_9PSEU|nr:type II toxin-antitoxin system VapC family toxin [Gandjariella thermophila]GDY34036.1 hypothetical protein GTS_56690 [Gandjariella thermophila]
MIGYFDTSAFVPMLVEEPSSDLCRSLWKDADAVVSTRLLYVEAAAALAQARRLGRLAELEHRAALRVLNRLWAEVEIVEVDHLLTRRAAELAYACALRGYDAVHCASAEQVDDDELVVVSGDRKLLAACAALDMATADINGT